MLERCGAIFSLIFIGLLAVDVGARDRQGTADERVRSVPNQAPATSLNDPDELYRRRADLESAKRAAELWLGHSTTEYAAAWKFTRICYWLGTHGPGPERQTWLKRGISAGETAVRLGSERPEGHFWLAANMGALAESFGVLEGIKYRGRIKRELERVATIDSGWQENSADSALGRWYFEVPRLLGGSRARAEEHLRYALSRNPQSKMALCYLADVLLADGRKEEARILLQRVIDAPIDPDWEPEDNDFKLQARERLRLMR